MKFISLLFHRIVKDPPNEWIDISEVMFDKFMQIIRETSLPVVKIGELASGLNNNFYNCGISITFDDGWESDYKIVFPKLIKYGFKATFFITTGWVNRNGYVNERWLKEMAECGMDIGSHTVTHRYLTQLSDREIYEEFYSSKTHLEDLLGKEIVSVSIPGGEYNRKILEIARKAGYKIIATSRPGINYGNSHIINRIPIHVKTSIDEFKKIASFSSTYLYQMQFFHFVRFMLKKIFGVNNYMKIKSWWVKKKEGNEKRFLLYF